MPDIECENCGGTDFYKDAGFFFCKGCQVQSQEVQEYAFDDFVAENRPKKKQVQSTKKEKVDKITSWECYNYILLGLTQELISLGAKRKLKPVVKILWLRYLEKLQVFNRSGDGLPKLQAVHSSLDGEIVYGKIAKKKRKRYGSSSEATLESSVRYERIKKKRALIKAQYDSFTQKTPVASNLHDETLTSLQTGSEKSSNKAKPLSYNIYACKELRKRIKLSRYHRDRHRADFDRNLNCHKITYRTVSWKYKSSPHILSLNKIYAILYLGLLIVRDRIQLSDMLRFIKEGHLSFNCYSHFFPDEFSHKILNFRNFKKNSVFSNESLRRVALEVARFVRVDFFVSCPNLAEMCERYCREMNLPDEVCYCAEKLIARSNVKMFLHKRATKMPSYEARVLSIVLFVLKLLFGLDDVTEFRLCEFAKILNKSAAVSSEMFDIIEWLRYIEYRNVVMTQENFSTNFFNSKSENVSLALGTLSRKNYPSETKCNADRDKYRQMLEKLKHELDEPENRDFPVTLTPFLDYSKVLPEKNYSSILFKDFGKHTLAYILKPNTFLDIVKNNESLIISERTSSNTIIEEVTCPKAQSARQLEENRKFVTVKLKFDNVVKTQRETVAVNQEVSDVSDCQVLNETVKYENKSNFDLDEVEQNPSESHLEHFSPYERFWIRFQLRVEQLGREDFTKFFEKFPRNFRLVFKECQRIAEQSDQDFLSEYQLTEHCLVYSTKFRKKSGKQPVTKDILVAKYLDRCRHLW